MRDRVSAHAEVLAVAAHFPHWIRAMGGKTVPHTWISGYQVTVPEHAVDKRLPALTWVNYRRSIGLTVDWADRSHSGLPRRSAWADRAVIRAALAASSVQPRDRRRRPS